MFSEWQSNTSYNGTLGHIVALCSDRIPFINLCEEVSSKTLWIIPVFGKLPTHSNLGLWLELELILTLRKGWVSNVLIIIINSIPILIRVCPRKRGWPDSPHSGSNLSNSHSPSRSIHCILLFQTNTPALLLHLHFPCLPRSSSLPLSLHFKL